MKKHNMNEGKSRKAAIADILHPLGDAPVENQFAAQMQTTIRAVNAMFNGDAPPGKRKVGIVLLVFPYGDEKGRCNYMSNGVDRDDVVKLLEEQIKRFKEPRG